MTRRSAADFLELLAGRWTLPVLLALRPGALRFGDLRRVVNSGISNRSLSMTLRRLEGAGLVLRSDGADPRRGRYELNPDGHSLLEAMSEFLLWAETGHPDPNTRPLRVY